MTTSVSFGQSWARATNRTSCSSWRWPETIGLEISAEELQVASGLTDELTDDQLDGVAGGRGEFDTK